VVLHFASPASPTDYQRYPVDTLGAGGPGTLAALELARHHGARPLLASTAEVYGDPRVHPQPETYWDHVNPVGPRSVYDEAKRYAEAATRAYRERYDLATSVARLFNTYGPHMRRDDGRAVPTFIDQALRDEPLTVAGDDAQARSLCYVDDLVGVLRLAEAGHLGPVNLGNSAEISVLDLALAVKEVTASSSALAFVPRPVDDPARRRPDITLTREVLGWTPAPDCGTACAVPSTASAPGTPTRTPPPSPTRSACRIAPDAVTGTQADSFTVLLSAKGI
jgi:dTDP-glucose 4,6-dehydratase